MLVCTVLLCSVWAAMGQVSPRSPCPDVFEYVVTDDGYEGIVTAPAPEPRGKLVLTVKMFTTTLLPKGTVGRLSQRSGTEDSVEFRLELPSQEPLTTIDEIIANDVSICQGPEVQARSLSRSTLRFTIFNYHPTQPGPVERPPTISTQRRPPKPTSRPVNTADADAAEDCGIAEVNLQQPLIAFGMPTEKGEWPWLAAIFDYKSNGLRCGGSLLDLRQVVTAAHCVQDQRGKLLKNDEIYVVMGKHNLKTVDEEGNQKQDVSQIRVHPLFNYSTFSDDIALLTLKGSVTYDLFVRPICLWKNDFPEARLITQEAAVVGWGRDEKGNMVTDRPQMAKAPIVSLQTCRASEKRLLSITNEKTLCAGYKNGTGPCTGDSGGGLMLMNPENGEDSVRYYLQGVVSVALRKRGVSRNCDLHHYVVYTNVNKYLEWLRQFIVESY